ncbi:hypothetical protein LEP1GSC193_0148 [Leptospira alstonii serovar Pingchang str. 80-412]|uniref:Transposase Tn5-like N-terminal domain-containing protein n=1 Tax=Leptospira alstonii serovar Pingchang str. 80-412 TaxID=1218564 RepID=T0H0B4_9LEPT|nr:hypothetical protein LEP1GSC193_0148 [Leptospira alstonii serovar Pingchang str. 80-412]
MTKRGGTSLPDIFGNWSGTKGALSLFFESESIIGKDHRTS